MPTPNAETDTVTLTVKDLRAMLYRHDQVQLHVNVPWSVTQGRQEAVQIRVTRWEDPDPQFEVTRVVDGRVVDRVDVRASELFALVPAVRRIVERDAARESGV